MVVVYSNRKFFSKLDLSQVYYAQIELEENSRKLVTLNTHKRLFQINRLPFGVASSPGIFQRIIDHTISGVEHVVVFMDDILIFGNSFKNHMQNLKNVFSKFQDSGLRLKLNKCYLFQKK